MAMLADEAATRRVAPPKGWPWSCRPVIPASIGAACRSAGR